MCNCRVCSQAVRQREEADSKLEQKWHGIVKEEGVPELHLAVACGPLLVRSVCFTGFADEQA